MVLTVQFLGKNDNLNELFVTTDSTDSNSR